MRTKRKAAKAADGKLRGDTSLLGDGKLRGDTSLLGDGKLRVDTSLLGDGKLRVSRRARSSLIRKTGMYYPPSCSRPPAKVPAGMVLVHNSVAARGATTRQGTRGFRFYFIAPHDRLTVCNCGWAPAVTHYRVSRSAN